ncbi:MAG: hypothetical protein K0Q79_1809 [Flavipsychrobacter sp.]|jgi:hypothetical protein|nr:hypothetical protein [Flavipsychrobacter sp.]
MSKNNKTLVLILMMCVGLFNLCKGQSLKTYFSKLDDSIYTKKIWRYSSEKLFKVGEGGRIDSSDYYESLISAALCNEYCYSNKVRILFSIFCAYEKCDSNMKFDLVSKQNNEFVYDLIAYNCSGMKRPFGTVSLYNVADINEIVSSYKKWYVLVKKKGLRYTQSKKISPLHFCDFSWRSDL